MARNVDAHISPTNSEEMHKEEEAQEPETLENDTNNLSAVLKRATSQANVGNWDAVIADAITAREIDPRSQDAWKLCARAALAGNDVEAALDCLHEALLIDHKDREAGALLQNVVENHLNRTLEGNERPAFVCDSLEAAVARFNALHEQFEHGGESHWEKLLCHIQYRRSLNRLVDSGKLTAGQSTRARINSTHILNTIGRLYNRLHEYRWALACHYFALYSFRNESASNGSNFNEEMLLNSVGLISGIAKDWFDCNKSEKGVEFIESAINIDEMKPSPQLCKLLINFGCMLKDLAKYDRMRYMLERAIKMAEEQDYKLDHVDALYSLGVYYKEMGNIECALSYLKTAEKKARFICNWDSLSSILNVIAGCLIDRGDVKGAIERADEAYKVNPKPELQLQYCITLGLLYFALSGSSKNEVPKRNENFHRSKRYFECGLKLAEEQHDPRSVFKCSINLGGLHALHELNEEAIQYLDAAANYATTFDEKRGLHQYYALCYFSKCSSVAPENINYSALEETEKWLLKSEECYNQLWEELKQDIDKITWSDQKEFANLIRSIQDVKWFLQKKLEALVVAERFRARSFRDFMQKRQQQQKLLIHQTDEMKAIARKLGQPIVFFSRSTSPDHFMCWIINPQSNTIGTQLIHLHPEMEESEQMCSKSDNFINSRNAIVDALRERTFQIINPNSHRTFQTQEDQQMRDYRFLFTKIWKCIEPRLKIDDELPHKVIIIPDEELWRVRFPLLTDENGTLLLHKHAISLALSISSLKTNVKSAELRVERNTAIVIGDPEVSSKDGTCKILPMATKESQNVKDFLEANSFGKRVEHLTGRTATKQAVLSSLPKARLFHIASHATDSTDSATQLPGGLLLASNPSTDESGILRSEEIQSLDLRGLQLAFLNCCHTGAGQVYAEGLIGLARAFIYAGAHDVVVSMRPVSDTQTTCDFVNKFYEEYLQNGEADMALNAAQKQMEQRRVDSSEWGSYYVIRQMLCD